MADKATWVKVKVNNLPKELGKLWKDVETAQAARTAARKKFETAFIAASSSKIAAGETLAFGYRWGGLAVAKIKTEDKSPESSGDDWF